MGIRPGNQFCCGCSLTVGVYTILVFHMLGSLTVIGEAFHNIILKTEETLGANISLTWQTLLAGYFLIGIPLMISAWYGVKWRLEPQVRVYFYYICLTFLVDLSVVIALMFLWTDTCDLIPKEYREEPGHEWACDLARGLAISLACVSMLLHAYCIYVVWSMCEDIKHSGAGNLADLLEAKKFNANYLDTFLQGGHRQVGGYPSTDIPVNYGALADDGLGESAPIFGGSYHETEYPARSLNPI